MTKWFTKKEGSSSGFTLLELMLAATLSSIIALSVGTIWIGANRNMLRSRKIVEMQRTASLAAEVIESRLRGSHIDDVVFTESGNLHTLYFNSTQTSYIQWDSSAGTLVLAPEGITLVSDEWTLVTFSASEQTSPVSWYVVLQLQDPQYGLDITMPVNYRPRIAVYE